MSGALRMVLISGFAVYVVLAPAHPCGLLASQASPVRSARPPPKGAPSDPRAFAFGFCYEFGSCSRTGYFGFLGRLRSPLLGGADAVLSRHAHANARKSAPIAGRPVRFLGYIA
jgi:hypothetical protein